MADKYVDFSATFDGDGTAYTGAAAPTLTGAYNTLVGKTFASGDLVWIRRTAKTITAVHSFAQDNVSYIGWPISGDNHYSFRPNAPRTTWDADGGSYAELTCTTNITLVTFDNVTTHKFYRMKFNFNYTSTGTIAPIIFNAPADFYNCYFTSASATTSTSTHFVVRLIHFGCIAFYDSIFEATGNPSSTGTGPSCVIDLAASGQTNNHALFFNCTIKSTNTSNTKTILLENRISQVNNEYNFVNCAFYNYGSGANTTTLLKLNANTRAEFVFDTCSINTDSTSGTQYLVDAENSTRAATPIVFFHQLSVTKGTKFRLTQGSYLNFKTFTQNVLSSTYCIDNAQTGMIISGNNITFLNNTTADIKLNANTLCLFTTITLGSAGLGTQSGHLGVWQMNAANKTLGLFTFNGGIGKVESSSIYRTGGASQCLKYTLTSGTDGHLQFKDMNPMLPGLETLFASVPASASTITIYGAHKGYSSNPADKFNCWAEIDYIDSNGDLVTQTTRGVAATLTSDGSTWNGDSSLTAFKLVLNITPYKATLCPVRIQLFKYVASAYVYFDPAIEVS